MKSHRPIYKLLIVVVLAALVVTLHIVRRNSTMRGLEVTVTAGGSYKLLDESEVADMIVDAIPGLLQTDIKDLDIKSVNAVLDSCPYVLDREVSVSSGGKLRVELLLRQPVVRMFYQDNEFYISRQGTFMPVTPSHYCHIMVGSTQFEEPLVRHISRLDLADTGVHRQPSSPMMIWKLASYLFDHPEYGDLFDQVVVNSDGDLCLVPKLGSLQVIVGDTSYLDNKFENLSAFLDQGVKEVGWDTYQAVSLKYNGQVVGIKPKI